jgi:predicted nucleic acid-binding protein
VKRIFLDSDIILDALLKRPGFEIAAKNVLLNKDKYKIYTSAIAFLNIHYFLDKFDRANKFKLLSELRSIITITEVGEQIIDLALNSGSPDFEDAVQYYAALSIKANAIVTRNIKDYKQSTIPVLTAEQFLKTI